MASRSVLLVTLTLLLAAACSAGPSPAKKVVVSKPSAKPGTKPGTKTPTPVKKPTTKKLRPRTLPIESWEGTYEGVCMLKLVGYTEKGKAAAKCLEEGVASLPYTVSYARDPKTGKISTKFAENAVTITKGTQTYFLPASGEASTSVTYSSINTTAGATGRYCLQVTFKDNSKAGYSAFVDRDGLSTRYVEEGVYDARTGAPTTQCPAKNNARLFCNIQKFVSYRCIAYKVPAAAKSG